MNNYLAITDKQWFEFHFNRKTQSVIFWKPSTEVYSTLHGQRFFFLVKGNPRIIGGYGVPQEISVSTVDDIWNRFGEKVGHDSLDLWLQEMNKKTGSDGSLDEESKIGYYYLRDVQYYQSPIIPTDLKYTTGKKQFKIDVFGPIEFKQPNVRGQYLSKKEVEWIESQIPHSLLHRSNDPEIRMQVERQAIQVVSIYYEDAGYKVKSVERDNLGWDLVVSKNETTEYIEVKGLSGNSVLIELTSNEYRQMRMYKEIYHLAVVTEALSENPTLSVFSFQSDKQVWVSQNGEVLSIDEIVSAKCFLS